MSSSLAPHELVIFDLKGGNVALWPHKYLVQVQEVLAAQTVMGESLLSQRRVINIQESFLAQLTIILDIHEQHKSLTPNY